MSPALVSHLHMISKALHRALAFHMGEPKLMKGSLLILTTQANRGPLDLECPPILPLACRSNPPNTRSTILLKLEKHPQLYGEEGHEMLHLLRKFRGN